MTFHYVYFQNFEPQDYHCPYLPQSVLILLMVLILDMMVGVKIVMILGAQVSNANLYLEWLVWMLQILLLTIILF
jgi:hypothetical protein